MVNIFSILIELTITETGDGTDFLYDPFNSSQVRSELESIVYSLDLHTKP